MAPALSVAPEEPHTFDTTEEIEKFIPLRRRALASVDNLETHMEEDDMGLQNQPSLAKDSQEMEQILVDLGSSDLAQADLLQAIKNFDSGADGLSTGDPDGIFPLSAFDLPEAADSEGDAAEDKIRLLQARLERRCAFLQRRLRILQARSIGKRISEEAAQTFDKCIKGARKDGVGRPVGLKAFLKRIETTAVLQASAASRSVAGPKYYHASTAQVDPTKSASVGVASGTLTGLEDTAGALRSHLSVVKHELDSDATASSSGAESNDEAVTYNNPHQQPMPIEKRALWSWQKARASIASRWCWLQAQVQELEYKIRQHNDLHKQVREAKGQVEFEGEPVAYEGSLPGSDADADESTPTCARVRPLIRETFKKRKLLQMHNLHVATTKAAKPADISCSCEYPIESCGVCTGRAEAAMPVPPASTLTPAMKLARIDPAYHPVLSDVKDIQPSVHLAAQAARAWLRARRGRPAGGPRAAPHAAPPAPAPRHKRPPTRLKRGRPPLSRKIRERDSRGERDEEPFTPGYERSRGRASTESRVRRQSYDIDNIVIPQSVAATTRPQILTYKEIITPKWRVLEIPEVPLNNGVSKSSDPMLMDSEEEDVSEGAVRARHVRAEQRERARYARKPRHRRANIETNNDALLLPIQQQETPPLLPPTPPVVYDDHRELRPRRVNNVAQKQEVETPTVIHADQPQVRPYSPRQFPLGEATYCGMVADMPLGHTPCSDPILYQPSRSASPSPESDFSALSPLTNPDYDGDDPDDAEWDPSAEKIDKKKYFR